MTEVDYLENLIAVVSHQESNAERRAGKVGPWCFVCGHESANLAPCACDYPREFGCVNLRSLCPDCRAAHESVSRFLTGMFREKKVSVPRVDARRSTKFRWLRQALEVLYEKHGNAAANSLRHRLGEMACPFGDEPAEFKRNVLSAFSRTHFTGFQKLATQLAEEERIHYTLRIAMSPDFQRLVLDSEKGAKS